ncbi:2-(3-amino-3-carboxypropyl)histidine synthase [Sporobolomyces salmoneus]|uniref:2-(3-amino-3-carboxypropyl)histidine synthase n=1 Tax=Sporobolomyces salmoneus TaxID=183962 RepID=UPI0031772458
MSQAPPPLAPTGEEAIYQTIDVEPEVFADGEEAGSLSEAYEVDFTLQEIEEGGYQRIGLQFADEQLHDAVPVYRTLREKLPKDKELYVLADTTYGSCCVDEVAAQHVDADFIVHYGHTCLSPTARLPVLYILTKRSIDPTHAASSLASTSKSSLDEDPPKAVVLLYDVGYAHKADLVADALRAEFGDKFPVVLSHLDKRANLRSHSTGSIKGKERESETDEPEEFTSPEDEMNAQVDPDEPIAPPPPTTVPRAPSRYDLPDGVESIEECALFWIGPESLALTNLLMTHGRCRIWSYDPAMKSCRLESARTNRMLMRRYALVEKAKDADVIGILVGTLGVAAYLPLITHLRQLIASHHKKSYTVAVGKLNPAKLANFIEVECFVLVACPENTMIDSKEFLRPIVTPFELQLALTSKAWTGQYILDFGELLSSSTFGQDQGRIADGSSNENQDGENGAAEEDDEEAPVYSATTGKYRHPKRYYQNGVKDADDLASQASALAIRDQNSAISRVLGSAAGEYMSSRTYKGLEPRYGEDAPAVLEMGREGGIARGYGYEKKEEES